MSASRMGTAFCAIALGVLAAPVAHAEVLHDQFLATGVQNVSSQNFEPALDAYDSLGADDFVVPAGRAWQLDRIEASGDRSGTGPINTANVFVFADGGGLPGALLSSRENVPRGSLADPDLDVTLAQMPALQPGRYWIGIQANRVFNPGANNWWWRDRAPQFGMPAAWRQPGDGFGDGCTAFAVRSSCAYLTSGATPDQAFRLSGASAGARLSVLKSKARRGGKLKLTVNAPESGKLSVRSKALKTATTQVSRIGKVKLILKPKPDTRAALDSGAVKVKLNVTLKPPAAAALRAKKKTRLKP
jgi:hypothetical protein